MRANPGVPGGKPSPGTTCGSQGNRSRPAWQGWSIERARAGGDAMNDRELVTGLGDRMGRLPSPVRMLLSVLGSALVWSAAYVAAFLALASVVWFLRPQDFGPGEGPAVIASTGLGVGFVSGAIFGGLAALVRSLAPSHRLPLW